jgi:hypothetical protein
MGTAIAVILVVASGPLFGFAALWLGCSATSILGGLCGHNGLFTLVVLMVVGWVGTAALLAALSGRKAS